MLSGQVAVASVLLWSSFVNGAVPKEFKDLSKLPGVKIDLRYASENNFTGKNLYGDFKKAFLHESAYKKLEKAISHLHKNHPGHNLLILDALRPRSVQIILFSKVEGTPQESYVANPKKGSVHNYGLAVDLTVVDKKGKEIDMGTPFDDFTDLAQPRYEDKFLAEKKLTARQISNRKILREAMEAGGFKSIPNEWWHFNALDIEEIKSKFTIVE